MVDYIKKVIKELPEEIRGRATIMDYYWLFKLIRNSGSVLLEKGHTKAFHKYSVHILFLWVRTQRDLELSIVFLSTRVKPNYGYDWVKLKQLFWYIRGSIYLTLTLGSKDLYVTNWFLDTSYMSHNDCLGNTGATTKLVHDAVLRMSHKNKLNTRISTKTDMVRVHDA